jgi:drug/metabolite transporter (DMT)-like permease
MNPKLSLIFGIICISFSPIFVKLVDAAPIVCGLYRMGFAWVCLAPYCLYKGSLKIARKDLILALIGGIVFGSDIAVWNMSIKITNVTVSTIVANLAPAWVGLLTYLVFKRKSGPLFWIGTCIAITGMVVLVGVINILQLKFNIGIIFAMASSLFYAIYILITKQILQRISTLTFMFYNMLAATVFMLIICIVQHDELLHYSQRTWLYLAATGILCQLIGWITINYAIMHLQSTKVSISLLSQTVVTGFLSFLLLNEGLQFKEIIGGVIVLTGIATTFLKPGQINKFVN